MAKRCIWSFRVIDRIRDVFFWVNGLYADLSYGNCALV